MSESRLYLATAPFEAACRLPILPVGHRARRRHGHSYLARIRAELPPGWAGFAGGETDQLQQALVEGIAPLDYADLNELLPVPSDENLARWLRARLAVPGIRSLGIRSTADTGVDLDEGNEAHIWHRFRFEAAHQLPRVAPGHKCGRMHGHGFEVILHANQDIGSQDMGIDFDRLAALWAPIGNQLHHACLNDLPGLENPTSERLADWVWQRLRPELPELSWVSVYETATAGCHYDGVHYRIWKEQKFESALRLQHAPAGDPRRGLHGHSYLLRLHLTAPLDEVMGWTLDYGDVKDRFTPVFQQLDHHELNGLPELADTDPASLARWMRARLAEPLPQLDRLDLYATPGCGVLLSWGGRAPALPA